MQTYNMDEMACYFDMALDQTLHFKGNKNVDAIDTGHRKLRFTVTFVLLCRWTNGKDSVCIHKT